MNERVTGDDQAFDPAPLLALRVPLILWGANHYASKLPDVPSWVTWDKRGDPKFYGKTSFADCELAWVSDGKPARMYKQIWNGIVREGEDQAKQGTGRVHPTQKPPELMRWCVERLGVQGVILDPYMGSGTTGIACLQMGRAFIGIEIEPRYFDIACERVTNAQRQERLFA